jgi:hypothetical protein
MAKTFFGAKWPSQPHVEDKISNQRFTCTIISFA